jgi:hypothetical protein
MSLIKYILQSCDDTIKYRVIFNGETPLDVGEVWNVSCDGIISGCYNVIDNNDEILEEFNGEECTFIEYLNCEECIEKSVDIDELTADAPQSCYRWSDCDTNTEFIYTPTSYSPPNSVVLYYGVCYQLNSPPITAYEIPTDLSSIPNNLFYNKCNLCVPCDLDCALTFGEVSNTPTPTITATPTLTTTPSNTNTPSVTNTPSNTMTPGASESTTPSNTATPTLTTTPSVTNTPSNTNTPSVTPTYGLSPSVTPTNTPTISVTTTQTPSVTNTPSNTNTPSVTNTPSNTNTPSVTNTPSNTNTPSVTNTPSQTLVSSNYYRLETCCENQTGEISTVEIIGGTGNVGDGFYYNGIPYYLDGTITFGQIQINVNDLIENICNSYTCPSETPTATPTLTQTPTLTLTPTPTLTVTATPSSTPPQSYSRFSLTPCCDNYHSSVTVLDNANILDSLGVNQGDVISLDNVCYTVNLPVQGVSLNTPSSQVLHNDCETCLSSQPQQYWCVYTYVACFEDQYNAGELMAAPVRYNTLLSTTNPVGGLYEHLQFTHTVTNISSQNVPFDDCYTYDSIYDETLPIKSYSGTHNGCCDTGIGAKCGGAYVVLRSCDDYYGDVTPLNGDKLDALVLMSCDYVSGSSIGGGVIQITDTINAPQLLGGTDYLGTVQDQIILEDGFSGICFTIVGETTSIKTAQNQLQGTDWATGSEVVTNCSSTNCHCLSNIGVENLSSSPVTLEYLLCGVSGSGNQDSISIPGGGNVTITDCINVNSVVLSRTNIPSFDVGDIQFDFGSSTPCDEYTYFSEVTLCCDSTDTPITGPVGLLNTLGANVNDYVVIDGNAYQITGSITTTGTQYPNATGTYTSCSNAVSNASVGCRYDFVSCCDNVASIASYYPSFSVQIPQIYDIGFTFYNTIVQPYPNQTDKCMSIQEYSGGAIDNNNDFLTGMNPNAVGCINRCSRCSFIVRPCGWSTNVHITVTVLPTPQMIPGTVWSDTGLQSWIINNGFGGLGVTNCYTILSSAGSTTNLGGYNGYSYTQTLQSSCSSSAC